jgi:hypothetical protein
MRQFTATELLGTWEQGLPQPPSFRALTLLSLAGSGTPPEKLAELPLGWRDAELLRLREAAFGPRIKGMAACPMCAQELELNFNVSDIQVTLPATPPAALGLNLDGHEVRFRLPNSRDLMALPGDGDEAGLKEWLLQRCVLEAKCDGRPTASHELPADIQQAISERMAEADPQADLRLKLTCPQCGHGWHSPIDIAAFLWGELHAWSVRLLREAHVIASTYGWPEADILAMSPWRRQAYLDLIGT